MNTMKNYLAAATMAATVTSGEGCTEQKTYPFPETVINNIMPTGIKAQATALVRDAVTKCFEGTFSRKAFDASRQELGSDGRNVNVVCKSGPNAEIHIGPEGVCTSSFETANGKDYAMGSINCPSGY